MNQTEDRIRELKGVMVTELDKIRLELARSNAIKVLEMGLKENLIGPIEYRNNLEKLISLYTYED